MSSQVERRRQLGFPSEKPVTLNPSKPIVQDKMVRLEEKSYIHGISIWPKHKLTLMCFSYPVKIVDLFACYDYHKGCENERMFKVSQAQS